MNFPNTNCHFCNNATTTGCEYCNPLVHYQVSTNNESKAVFIEINPQLDRIEAKLDKLLEAKKPKPRSANTIVYSAEFLEVWEMYPKRSGSNPKRKAYSAYNARVDYPDEATFQAELTDIYHGVKRYARFCKEANVQPQYILQTATFLGPDKRYLEDWTIPTQAETMPKSNDELVAWSANKGFRSPQPGESFDTYRRAVTQLYRQHEDM